MSKDGGLGWLFEKPLPKNPTLLESLSARNHILPKKPVDPASFTEMFGELYFQEKANRVAARRALLPPTIPPPPRATAPPPDAEMSKDDSSLLKPRPAAAATVKRSASFCMKSVLLCTEGLGCESAVDTVLKDDVLDAVLSRKEGMDEDDDDAGPAAEEGKEEEEERRPPSFPPPIRSISVRGGKPSVCFRSFREKGRFVLVQVVVPGKELLQASRDGGRLRLQFTTAAPAPAPRVD